ncbi:uncharacterized protein LOC143606115 [Bidens hawaiensis]|uniref:uncharacterized protein LOC143606115 n=1 Tax=Bidens hawaiensis TaxID=980011 RepID=UPI00404B0CB1
MWHMWKYDEKEGYIAAVVYTVASIYTRLELTFKKVMSVVPKFSLGVLSDNVFVGFLFNVVLVVYVMGFVYMTVVWQLASVVSVLESCYGIKAMTKSIYLIKGNRSVAITISFMLNMSFVFLQYAFELLVVEGGSLEAWKRVVLGVVCLVNLLTLFLYGLVIQTILSLVCKSYHHENIDKGDLSDHLESYLGDYEPLIEKDVQLEQYRV